jgi:hypothetical protein
VSAFGNKSLSEQDAMDMAKALSLSSATENLPSQKDDSSSPKAVGGLVHPSSAYREETKEEIT